MKTKVKFYLESDEHQDNPKGSVFAYFPYEPDADPYGNKPSYAHVGQHSAANIDYVNACKEASEAESQDLMKELSGLGYELEVLNSWARKPQWIELYTELMDKHTEFDEIEVHGVRDIYKDVRGAEEGTCFEQCEDSEAEMWSVYIHIPYNGLECIADCETRELAEALRDMLLIAGKLFIRN